MSNSQLRDWALEINTYIARNAYTEATRHYPNRFERAIGGAVALCVRGGRAAYRCVRERVQG